MHRSIATVCLSGTLPDKLDAISSAGFDGIELFENDLVTSPMAPREVAALCADLGLSIDLYQPFRNGEGVPPAEFCATLRRFERKLDLMAELGTDTVLVCSSVATDGLANDDVSAHQLWQLAEVAARHERRIAFEALAWGTQVSTWTHAWDLVRQADHPALGLCLDSFHIGSLGTTLDRLTEIPADKIFFVQLADAPRLAMDILQWSRHHRVFPGQGAFDLAAFLAAVLARGYRGPLSLEVFNDVFRQADPWRTAVDGLRSLLTLEDHVAGLAPDSGLATLPQAPGVAGVAFVELGVDGVTGPLIGETLQSLGFSHVGQHRSKPVELWQQGDARIVLNVDVGSSSSSRGSATVRAIAVDSANPADAAKRAEALLARRVDHERAAGESELATVLAPDGSELIFCRRATATTPASWAGDFVPTGLHPRQGAPLCRIDHVALSAPFDYFEEAGLFYRSVLGLDDDSIGEFAAPYGLVRTHAVSDPSRTVRIALSVALLRRGAWAPGEPAPQHVAFATEDLPAAVGQLRRLDVPLLAIPDNYYADLRARLDLSNDLVESLRAVNALYDQDSGGQFLHVYTELVGSVFFEIVQRIGDYRGYGESNAPVRMAAHRATRLAQRAHLVDL
jgi:4-hydroxyphenylpyruvate dioxygenase